MYEHAIRHLTSQVNHLKKEHEDLTQNLSWYRNQCPEADWNKCLVGYETEMKELQEAIDMLKTIQYASNN